MDPKFQKRLDKIWDRLHPSLYQGLDEAIRIVSQAGGQSFREVLAKVRDRRADPADRQKACLILPALGDRRAIPALLAAARDPSAETRASAVNALGLIRSPRVFTELIRALHEDPDESVCLVAASSVVGQAVLGVVDPSAVLRFLHDYMQQPHHVNLARPVSVRRAIVRALWFVSHPRAVALLVAALHDPDPEVRFWAARSMRGVWECMQEHVDSTEAIRGLERLVSTDEAVIPRFGSIREEASLGIDFIRRRQQKMGASDG